MTGNVEPEGDANVEQSSSYLDRLMRRRSFEALWPLFANATRPAKELTESFSALEHLRPWLDQEPCRVIHIGDGAHARTAALFALKTRAHNISVDPSLNEPLVEAWRARYGIERIELWKARIEDVAAKLDALPRMRVLLTFVHAHVPVDAVLAMLRWDVAFTLVCCLPGHQFSRAHPAHAAGVDARVLSTGRRYQVLSNAGAGPGGMRIA